MHLRTVTAFLLLVSSFLSPSLAAQDALERARSRGHLLWGADPEGGAPYVFADPQAPARTVGFEWEIAQEIGQDLGLPVRLKPLNWGSIYQDLARGEVDFAMNGLEVWEETRKVALFTRPYYIFSQQLVVRAGEERIASLEEVRGRPAGTLGGTLAERMLQQMGALVRTYDGQVEPYEDLELGRVDAVLLDRPIAKYYASPTQRPTLRWVGDPIGRGEYAIAVAPGEDELKERLDQILGQMIADGRLARILKDWDLWDDRQWGLVRPEEAGSLRGLFAALQERQDLSPMVETRIQAEEPARSWILRHGPLLLQAAGTTVVISVAAMALAILLGIPLAIGRLYGGLLSRSLTGGYIELFRGTPVMLQLYVLYYALPHLPWIGIQLPPLTAAIVGLGLNYAAYEAEIYRAGLLAVHRGQLEAALALGMTRVQAIRRILLPQAVRIVIPPVTNDFVSLFKDTSIVSVIAIQELTKRFYILGRSDVEHFAHLAAATAILYLLMSYPLGAWSRQMERRLRVESP